MRDTIVRDIALLSPTGNAPFEGGISTTIVAVDVKSFSGVETIKPKLEIDLREFFRNLNKMLKPGVVECLQMYSGTCC